MVWPEPVQMYLTILFVCFFTTNQGLTVGIFIFTSWWEAVGVSPNQGFELAHRSCEKKLLPDNSAISSKKFWVEGGAWIRLSNTEVFPKCI